MRNAEHEKNYSTSVFYTMITAKSIPSEKQVTPTVELVMTIFIFKKNKFSTTL